MPIALAIALTLSLFPWSPQTDDAPGTVRLLVADDVSIGPADAGEASDGDSRWHRVEVPIRGSVEQTAASLAAESGSRVIVEQRYELLAPEDDPRFAEQWYLENGGQSGGVPDADIDALTAWGSGLGNGIVVAVIDSGVNMAHTDLVGQIHSARRDFVDNDNNPSPSGTTDDEGHGTAVAGIIAAAENGLGITGVAPEATIMAIRSCSQGACWSFDIAEGIYYAADNGADVINLSLGSVTPQGDEPLEDAIAYARSRDVVVVAAAGNSGTNLDDLDPGEQLIPGGLPFSNILTVGATNRRDNLAGFSNYGPGVVDIAAPGVDILTTGISSNTS
ncbi:MAG TPA: S8 family serine peptidase, partial [Acidimicrobiia bacterium]|nr:S8 family serine peptidase [Acidimicrobiia bacterium]